MSRQQLLSRLGRLSARQRTGHVLALATRYSEASGIPVDDLLAEAERIARHFQDVGAETPEAQREVLAEVYGITRADLEAELCRLDQSWA